MFTGIITHIGKVKSKERKSNNSDTRFVIEADFPMESVAIGASIACSGACMTVVEKGDGWFAVDVSDESLRCTTMGDWDVGTEINLERSLCVGDELGGHIVTGHVDGLAEVIKLEEVGGSHAITFRVPDALKCFVAAKGSVALDGISLTVNSVENDRFTVNIIPHTWEHTTMRHIKVGSKLHFEADVLARYILRSQEI